ncbi:MAG: DNA adenine methylase [Alphaproteobacteria bacterium]|nr:DNA adenine methylase [Alphaproteobacteria bacterium]MDA8029742.1 DNA adenine methylase [Alphaproteobacteria bacterium]
MRPHECLDEALCTRPPSRAKSKCNHFQVKNARASEKLKLIPYVGCKADFAKIFDDLMPPDTGRVYDLFGGGGAFTFYACAKYGSRNVTYNDNNPVITNLMLSLGNDPGRLHAEYERHRSRHSPDYYLEVRDMDHEDGIRGAGRFFYLAKNAFSGKIRFNSKNRFNSPMRKGGSCPMVDPEHLTMLSNLITNLTITCEDFRYFEGLEDSFIYLDPPYMNNYNGHYNQTVPVCRFSRFLHSASPGNHVMISEQGDPEGLGLPAGYTAYRIILRRSLQYFTRRESSEIIAVNYDTGIKGKSIPPHRSPLPA